MYGFLGSLITPHNAQCCPVFLLSKKETRKNDFILLIMSVVLETNCKILATQKLNINIILVGLNYF